MKTSDMPRELKDKYNATRRKQYAEDKKFREYMIAKAKRWQKDNPEKRLASVKKKQEEYKQLRLNDYQAWERLRLR